MPLILPTTKLPPTRRNPKTLLLYGPPKVGKTTILSQLDNCLIVELEAQGADFIEALKIDVKSLTDLKLLYEELVKASKPYKFIAIDTVDELESWCEVYATNILYKQSAVGKSFTGNSVLELPNGGGYLWLRQAFHYWWNIVAKMADHIIFIGHVRDKQLGGAKIGDSTVLGQDGASTKDLDLTGKVRNIACSQSDAIGFINRNREGKLMITFKTKEDINCGTRCDHLKGQEFEFDWKRIYLD